MCGIFGFVTRHGEGPEIARLRRIAWITQTRGEHAFGLAWLNAEGKIGIYKHAGPARSCLEVLERCRDALVVVGHCRYATHGSPSENRNNHPHTAGGGLLVHNGVVFNHQELSRQYHLRPRSQCDSEVLGLLIGRCPGTITQRAAWTANQAAGDLALLGVWTKPARLLVARRGRPLNFGQGRDGYYFGSLPEGLPGRPMPVADRTCRVLTFDGQGVDLEAKALTLGAGGGIPQGGSIWG